MQHGGTQGPFFRYGREHYVWYEETQNHSAGSKTPLPGIEPGSSMWQAEILAIILQTADLAESRPEKNGSRFQARQPVFRRDKLKPFGWHAWNSEQLAQPCSVPPCCSWSSGVKVNTLGSESRAQIRVGHCQSLCCGRIRLFALSASSSHFGGLFFRKDHVQVANLVGLKLLSKCSMRESSPGHIYGSMAAMYSTTRPVAWALDALSHSWQQRPARDKWNVWGNIFCVQLEPNEICVGKHGQDLKAFFCHPPFFITADGGAQQL